MTNSQERIYKGIITRVIVTKNRWSVCAVDVINEEDNTTNNMSCAGSFVLPSEGQKVAMTGTMETHPVYGPQIRVASCVVECEVDMRKLGYTEEALTEYLKSGSFYGIGEVYSHKLYKAFGTDVLDVIENEPEKLLTVKGISKRLVKILQEGIAKREGWQYLVLYFSLTKNQAKGIYEKYKDQSYEILSTNPYIIAKTIRYFGFKRMDSIALRNGFDPLSEARVSAALHYLLEDNETSGNCYYDIEEIKSAFERAVNASPVPEDNMLGVLQKEVESGEIICVGNLYCSRAMFYTEQTVSACIKELVTAPRDSISDDIIKEGIRRTEAVNGFAFEEYQTGAIKTSLKSGFSVITGGPGTGKTTILRAILQCWRLASNDRRGGVILCAPTGKAAKRMTETTGNSARTIHSLLLGASGGYVPPKEMLLVVDETSMVEIGLACKLLELACKWRCRVILVGDANQLPPIGPGKVFKDVIASKTVPTSILQLCHRQSGSIAVNADRINRGCAWKSLDFSAGDTRFVDTTNDESAEKTMERITELYKRLRTKYETSEIGVIVPFRKEKYNTISANELNKRIKQIENPAPRPYVKNLSGEPFYIGDRVMNTKNEINLGLCNGDCGVINDINFIDETVTLLLDDGKTVIIGNKEVNNLVLAYAMTVHKSQGSEYKVVITEESSREYIMLQRNLLYTAITRAKELVYMFGEAKAYAQAIHNNPADKRKTLLIDRLLGKEIVVQTAVGE